jgi:hypothetical protein
MDWLNLGLLAGAVYLVILGAFAAQRRWTWAAMGVALANFLFVLLHLMAPFRGALDPGYAGYRAGMLHAEPGLQVTLLSGTIVVAALASACLALRSRPGRGMVFIAVVDALLLVTIGLPELLAGVSAPEAYRIELGEAFQLPGAAAVAALGLLLCLPLVLSIVWSARRTRPAAQAA